MQPVVTTFFDSQTSTYSYVVRDPGSQSCVIIDSVLDYDPASGRTSTDSADKIVAFVREQNLTVLWLLETHVHADHLSAAPYLQQQLGGLLAIGAHITTVQQVFAEIFNAEPQFATDGSQFDRFAQRRRYLGMWRPLCAGAAHTWAYASLFELRDW